jgi:hypothetical protein
MTVDGTLSVSILATRNVSDNRVLGLKMSGPLVREHMHMVTVCGLLNLKFTSLRAYELTSLRAYELASP